ncbi:hypothetical protein RclHR1_07620010 [Rhizophagus clarus]|uniref:Uncharacterized protein LOC106055486 isoform X1 n=1 Tax=Rhizophagus clarus TaxID=94130 RepID=A0A2Z6SDI7_9GLOM|nr:hypothetical protein RclHR1_07620010 [Rhizophagus clarus]GES93575.1 uncharacterized protein LOC106055486 isoform X1 [Rhizophagus clarus]
MSCIGDGIGTRVSAIRIGSISIKRKYGNRAKLCYIDTDSFIEIETENIYDDMVEDADLYDFSDYPEDIHYSKNYLSTNG